MIKLIQLFVPLGNGKKDINGLIIHGILFLASASAILFRLNLSLHAEKFIQLVNEMRYIDSEWGKKKRLNKSQ